MARVSVGQVENLTDLVGGLESVSGTLETACREQVAAAELLFAEAREEAETSGRMLEEACCAEQQAQQALEVAQRNLELAEHAVHAAEVALAAGGVLAAAALAGARATYAAAYAAVAAAQAALRRATQNRMRMERRVDCAKQALSMAEQVFDLVRHECNAHMLAASVSIDTGKARLAAAHRALETYLSTNAPAARFREWLYWHPESGKTVAPDFLRDHMDISGEQQILLQEYLYDRQPGYRRLVDKYRADWANAKGDVERNVVNRKARIHLSGEFAEQLARHALAPLGGRIETQGRTLVGNEGAYTKTDLLVRDLRVPVILGRGESMMAPAGGTLAFEVKCGKADYLFAQMGHMAFQAEGHKHANAHCTLCSRDIHELTPGKQDQLRKAMREAGSPLVGMLPLKNDIDRSCLAFIHQDKEGDLN